MDENVVKRFIAAAAAAGVVGAAAAAAVAAVRLDGGSLAVGGWQHDAHWKVFFWQTPLCYLYEFYKDE